MSSSSVVALPAAVLAVAAAMTRVVGMALVRTIDVCPEMIRPNRRALATEVGSATTMAATAGRFAIEGPKGHDG